MHVTYSRLNFLYFTIKFAEKINFFYILYFNFYMKKYCIIFLIY